MNRPLSRKSIQEMRNCQGFTVWLEPNPCYVRLQLHGSTGSNGSYTCEIEDGPVGQHAVFGDLYASGAFKLIAKTAREGDLLYANARQNGNEYHEHAIGDGSCKSLVFTRLFHDELMFTLIRKGKVVADNVIVCDSTTPDNSARSIKSV